MPVLADLQAAVESLPEQCRIVGEWFIEQARRELALNPHNSLQVLWELRECVEGLQWDAANGGTDPLLIQEAQLWMSSLPA
jgi:hypothetical protein